MSGLLPVKDALSLILSGVMPIEDREVVDLQNAGRRVLADDLTALRTQPPFPASAMDGYAVRHPGRDGAASFRLIGEAAAGHPFAGTVGSGECVRIFTGAPVPPGADTVLIQENANAQGTTIAFEMVGEPGRFVRPEGLDFRERDTLLTAGSVLTAACVSLCAAMGRSEVPVTRRPSVAVLANGDELRLPGEATRVGQIVASNSFGVAQIAREAGAEAIDLGIARDDVDDLAHRLAGGVDQGSDVIVTLGGASVGDHDLVALAFERLGVRPDFLKLAMRPGKPVMFGRSPRAAFLGLPGNPVSSLVGAHVFLRPLLYALAGRPHSASPREGVLARDLNANDEREEYARATLEWKDGRWVVDPFPTQDSSMLQLMARSHALLIRSAHAPKARAGDPCSFLPIVALGDLRNKARTD